MARTYIQCTLKHSLWIVETTNFTSRIITQNYASEEHDAKIKTCKSNSTRETNALKFLNRLQKHGKNGSILKFSSEETSDKIKTKITYVGVSNKLRRFRACET